MTYTELCAAVSAYVENTFEATELATFCQQAERRTYHAVQLPALRKNVTGALTISNKYLACPSDFLATYSLAIVDPVTGEFSYLLNKDVNFLREAYPSPTATSVPKYYALFGPQSGDEKELTFIVAPTPDKAYAAELHYFFYPESISVAASGRSWLGDNYDPVLFYGMLVEAYTFLKGEQDMLVLYNTKFNEAMQQLKRLGDGLERTDAYRSGQATIKVP